MSKRRITTYLVLGTIGCLVAGSLIISESEARMKERGGPGHSGPEGPFGGFFHGIVERILFMDEELGLTDDQFDQLKGIVREYRSDLEPRMKTMGEKGRSLRQAVIDEDSDASTIRNAAEELGNAIGDAAVAVSETFTKARTILTEDQIAQLEEIRESHQKRRKRMMELRTETRPTD